MTGVIRDADRYCSPRKAKKPMGSGAPHLPNKQEGAELRKIMSKTGLSADEVRALKVYRQQLAKAQQSPMKGDPAKRRALEIKRASRVAANHLKLPAYDPAVKKYVREHWPQLFGMHPTSRYWSY